MDISFLGPAAASVLIVGMFLKYMRDESDRRDKANEQLTVAINKNTEAQKETTKVSKETQKIAKETKDFLVNLNGSLKKTVREKQEKAKQ